MSCLIYEKWGGLKIVAFADTWTQALPYSREKRYFLKIHNRSKTDFLKIAFSQAEADNDIYVLVGPGGFWEMENVVPRNEVLVNGDAADCDVIIYQLTY